jgi:hypothetical protein
MMKVIRVLLIFGLVILALGTASIASAGAFDYTSAYQVQNLEGDTANIQIVFFNQDGTSPPGSTVNTTISANSSESFFVVTQLTDPFDGSIVISSDNQIASIANVHGDSYFANASYVAASAGSTTVQLPLLMKGNSGYNTWFNVQNIGGVATNVTVDYTDGTSVGPVSIQPNATHTFDQALEAHSSPVFAAVVTSVSQPIAITVIEENTTEMYAYSGGQPVASPVIPLVNANNSGYTTGIAVYNTGGTSTTVTMSYTASLAGTDCQETQTIPANSFAGFALAAFATGANSNCTAGATFIGSAEVTANSAGHPLGVVVNQHILGLNGEAYGGFSSSGATDTVVFPLIMDRNSGWWTGISVMNVGGSTVTVTCDFTNTTYTASDTLAPGEPLLDLQNHEIAAGYIGSATCTAPGGLIVGIVNEVQEGGTSDQFMVYEGINLP